MCAVKDWTVDMSGNSKKPAAKCVRAAKSKKSDKLESVDFLHHHDCPFFESFLNESCDPIVILTNDGVILFINRAIEELFGVKLRHLTTYEEFMLACYPDKAIRETAIKESEKDMKSAKSASRLREVRRPDGSVRWFYRKVKKMPDGNIMMVGQDVTELKRAELDLERVNYALENCSDAVFWINAEGKFFHVNKTACESLGYSKKELLSMGVYDIDPLYSKKSWSSRWKNFLSKKSMSLESMHKTKEGVSFPVELSVSYDVFEGEEFLCVFARDVTARKQSDEALLESEANFKKLSEVAFEAIVIHDTVKVINANKRFYDMYGYTEKDLRNKNIIELMVAPGDLLGVQERIDARNQEIYETTHVRKDGTEFPVEVRVREMEYDGHTVRVAAILDVSDRKQTAERLLASELQFKNIVESSPIGMYIYQLCDNDNLILLGANPAADKMVGTDNSKKIGLTIEDAFPLLKGTEIPDKYRDVARTGVEWFSEQVDYKDDHMEGAFEVHAFQTAPNIMVAAFVNVTARKSSQAEMKRLAAAVESAAESIIVTDASAHITYVNPWFETMTGYSREEVLHKHIGILQSGEHDHDFYRDLWTTIKGGATWRGRFVNKKRDGSLFEEDAVISPVIDSDGEIVNFVAVKRDVTQEVLLENQVMQSQKMAAIGQLAHKIAHNFTNILVIILGNAQMAKKYMPKGSEALAHIDEVVKAANRVSTLTSELLSFAHPAELRLRPRKLNKALQGLEDLLRETLASSIELILDIDDADIKVNVDAVQIEQALLHLAINADDAIGKTSGSLTIKAGRSDYGEGFAMISVSDTGRGLSEEMQKQVFDPFFSTKEAQQNPGLGLATVYTIVHQHKGFISVDSKVGVGTTFKIYLPLA